MRNLQEFLNQGRNIGYNFARAPSVNYMLFKCVLAYLVVFYSQIGLRIPLLGSLRIELILGILILVGIGVVRMQEVGRSDRNGPLTFSIIFLFVAMALSIPGSAWKGRSVDTMFTVFKMFALYIMIIATIDTETKLRQFMWVYILMVALVVGEPFVGTFTGSALWDSHRGYPKLKGMTGLWEHPNSLGGFAAGNLAFLYYMYFAEQKIIGRYFLVGLGVVSLGTIVYTGSRTAYVGVIGLGIILWLRSSRKGLALAGIPVLLVLVWILAPEAYKNQFLTIGTAGNVIQGEESDDGSMNDRWEIITDAVAIFLDHPILGVGVDAFMAARGERFDRWQDTHNLYLQVLTNIGIIGAVAFLMLLYRIFDSLNKAKQVLTLNRSNSTLWLESLASAVGAFLGARLIVGMFGMDLYENYWWLAAGLAGVLLRLAQAGESQQMDVGENTLARSWRKRVANDRLKGV
jgi:O-antigen ligase